MVPGTQVANDEVSAPDTHTQIGDMLAGSDEGNHHSTRAAAASEVKTPSHGNTSESQTTDVFSKAQSNQETSIENDAPSSEKSNGAPHQLSKKQRKRLLKREKIQDKKRQMKEERRAQAIADGRDLVAEQRLQAERTALGYRKRRLELLWQTEKLPLARQSFQICVDCSFEPQMQPREIASLAQQLKYCYSYNKNAPNPCLVAATSLQEGDTTLTLLRKEVGLAEWAQRLFTCTSESLEDYYRSQSSKVIYLTSDSDTILEKLEDDKIYVIGGIVDRNRLKRVAVDRAERLGLATAKLPLDSHLAQMDSTPVLACNHVFNILLKCRQYGNDWSKALQDVLPSRKDAKFGRGKEQAKDEDTTPTTTDPKTETEQDCTTTRNFKNA